MASSMKERETKGKFPLSNLQFDIVMLLSQKSKALEAYDKYIQDAQVCAEGKQLLEEMKEADFKQVEQLKKYLTECLSKE
jgi:ribosomal protein S18